MLEGPNIGACVRDWIARACDDAGSDRLCLRFEDVFLRLWRRAGRTLGDVTLGAIVDRVLHTAGEQFPILGHVELDESGPRFEQFRARCEGMRPEELIPAFSAVLHQFVTVLDTLTAGVLTPGLHAELAATVLSATTSAPLHPRDGSKP